MKVIEVTEEKFESEVLNSNIPVLVDFNADWCGPCKMLRPVLEELAEEVTNTKIAAVNVDDNQNLAIKYNVSSIPCLVLIKEGKEENRLIGLRSKSDIKDFLGE